MEYARRRHAAFAPRLQFEAGDAFALPQPDNAFDLVASRHMVQAVPHVERILAELVRVTKPGGHVHVLAEDYTMLHMMSGPLDPDVFWRKGPVEFSERTGTDSRIGRRAWTLMRAAGLIEVRVDYVSWIPCGCRAASSRTSSRPGATGTSMPWRPRNGHPPWCASTSTKSSLQYWIRNTMPSGMCQLFQE